ncbi:MAG: hypothetical protein AAF585_26470, partial [Verrucomicrobiota bacterium]
AEKDLFATPYWFGKNRIMATVLVGAEGFSGVKAAANEVGGDGTVRASTASLNATRLELDFTGSKVKVKDALPPRQHQTAFAILKGLNHGTITMSDEKVQPSSAQKIIYKRAIEIEPENWDAWCDALEQIRDSSHDEDNHEYQNTVVRVYDDIGNVVTDYFIEFYEHDADSSWFGRIFHEDALQSVHKHSTDSQYRNLYIDVTALHDYIDEVDEHLNICIQATPEFDPEKAGPQVGYPSQGEVSLTPELVRHYFKADRTLLIDIKVRREMRDVFVLKPIPEDEE